MAVVNPSKCNYIRVMLKLAGNGLRFRYPGLMRAPLKPTVISLALTNRCNSRCIMCNIWRRALKTPEIGDWELSGQEIMDLLSRPLFSKLVELDLTGGELHLRDDLADIVLSIAGLKKSFLPGLRSIILSSNGLLPQKTIANYRKILDGMQNAGIDIVGVSSFDGFGQTHDVIRGTRGAFELATATIDGLQKLRDIYPSFLMGIKATILPQNVSELGGILDFARERNLFHIISSAYFTETRYRNMGRLAELTLGPAERRQLLEFQNREELQGNYFYATARGYLVTGRRQWRCAALHSYMFIDFDGKVYPCELISEPVGDVRKQNLEDIWSGTLANSRRPKIGKLECCAACNEPGAIRYSACAEGFSYLRFLRKLGVRRFGESFLGEGLIKYCQPKAWK